MRTRQLYLVCYDISEDKKRLKVADRLQYFGLERLQYSVFWGPLKRSTLQALVAWTKKIELGEGDRIAILPLHRESLEKAIAVGKGNIGEILDDFESDLMMI